jgi:hypothetical protein
MRRVESIFVGLAMLTGVPVWSQVDNIPAPPDQAATAVTSDDSDTRMPTPPPVSGQSYPVVLTSQERSNYLRGGVNFTSAYSDNVLGSMENHPVSDVSYSVAPFVALDTTTAREHFVLTYAPGYTFYRRTSARNEADQNAAIEFQYRLSPHVTFSAADGFQKSSNVFNQPDLTSTGAVSGGTQGANFSVIAPIADRLGNSGNLSLAYQFSRNGMIGGSGTFSNLHYSNPAQVPGLSDSSTQAGSAFYALRISRKHYFGVTYGYQRLLSYPTAGVNETQTHAGLLFYTVYPAKRLSISFFGGSQYSDTVQSLPTLAKREWTPAGGASLSWQGRLNSFALGYVHIISGGSGLIGAVQMDSGNASVRQQITKSLSASVAGGYTENNLLGGSSASTTKGGALAGAANGHSISGTASLQQSFGPRITLQLGYTRLRQDYSGVTVLALTPDTNREFVSLSYQFAKALGR